MKFRTKVYVVFFVLLFTNSIVVPKLSAQNDLLIKEARQSILKKADSYFYKFKYDAAAEKYEKYLNGGMSDSYALSQLAECYWQTKDYNKAFFVYKRLYPSGNKGATKEQQFRIAEMFAREHQYKLASKWLIGINEYQSKALTYASDSLLRSMQKDSLNWHLGFLNVNTIYQEFSPVKVDSVFLFSSNRPNRNDENAFKGSEINYDRLWKLNESDLVSIPLELSGEGIGGNTIAKEISAKYKDYDSYFNENHHFFYKYYHEGETSTIANLVKGLNKMRYNVGTVSVDKNNHYYFTTNYSDPDKVGINRLRLVEAIYNKRSFKTKYLPFGNAKKSSVMHSSVNGAGTLMVFSSNVATGRGGCDLYYSKRNSINEQWSEMTLFGSNVNTGGNEVFPTITEDGYLYFSSDALPGLGGLDIFRIPLADALSGKGKPEHIAYPINSSGDDFGWTQDSVGLNGYFTSDRLSHNNDLYSFYYKEPVKISYFENKVLNKDTNLPIEGATLFLLNKTDGKVYIAKTDKEGRYTFKIPDAKQVIVKAMVKGFSNYCLPSKAISITQPKDTVQKASTDFSLEKLKINYAWKLPTIYYALDKSDLSLLATPILDSLINILQKHSISVEISSFTDSRGSKEYNYQLSVRRSESVINYLTSHGVDSTRLIAKGYGETKLLNRCSDGVRCSEDDHKVNRRTEVKVLDIDVEQKSPDAKIDLDEFKDGDVVNLKALPLGFIDECLGTQE
jgi:outer membrane protein OmpA-like peptidoglycan-associated protein